MGLVTTQSHKYIIHPVESGAGIGSPHIMFNAEDWSMLNGTTERIDGNICDRICQNPSLMHTMAKNVFHYQSITL